MSEREPHPETVAAVVSAWTEPGRSPQLLRHYAAELRAYWPHLADALDKLTTEAGRTPP